MATNENETPTKRGKIIQHIQETALTFTTLNSLSNILRRGTVSGEKKFPSFARNTPFLKASSSSVVGGNSSFRQASIHLKMIARTVINIKNRRWSKRRSSNSNYILIQC